MFALNAGQSLDVDALSVYVTLWQEAFADLPDNVLEAAFRKTLATCQYWPVKIADVRARIENANSAGLELEAAKAWDQYLAHVKKFYHPDLGWDRHTPCLNAITEHAGSAAGGAHWVEGCPEAELQWARKRFLDAYTLAHETRQDQHLLTRGEAKKSLASLTSEAPQKQLPQPEESRLPKPESLSPDNAALRAFDDLREKLNAPQPRAAARPAQGLDERLAELQRQAEEVRTKYGSHEAAP